MKKTILFSAILSILISGCGSSSEPEGMVSEPSMDIVKGFYYVANDVNESKKYYLDIDADGGLHPYTFFNVAGCAMSAEAGETNYVLKDHNLTLDKNNSRFVTKVDGKEVGWRYNDKNVINGVFVGDKNKSNYIVDQNIIISIAKSPVPLSSISCEGNFSARQSMSDLLVGKTLFIAYHKENNSTASVLDEIKIGDENNNTMMAISYSLPDMNITESNSTDYNLTNGEFKFNDDENITCVLKEFNATSVTLQCHPDTNASASGDVVMWNTKDDAINNPVLDDSE